MAEASAIDNMMIEVKVNGMGGPRCTLSLPGCSTLKEAKGAIEEAINVPVAEQRVLSSTCELQDDALVGAVACPGQHCIELTLLRRDPEQVAWLQGIAGGERFFAEAPAHIRGDQEVATTAITSCGAWQLEFASEELRGDKEFVMAVVTSDFTPSVAGRRLGCGGMDEESAIKFAHQQFSGNKGGSALEHASEQLRDDKEVVLAAVANYPDALKHASERLRGDKDVVLAATAEHLGAFSFASQELRGDKDMMLAAVAKGSEAFWYASEQLRADKEVVLAVVSKSWMMLNYAPERLQRDKDVIRAAESAREQGLGPRGCCF